MNRIVSGSLLVLGVVAVILQRWARAGRKWITFGAAVCTGRRESAGYFARDGAACSFAASSSTIANQLS